MNDFLQCIRDGARRVFEKTPLPDRLNQDWRCGHPDVHAAALSAALAAGADGSLRLDVRGAGKGVSVRPLSQAAPPAELAVVRSIGSESLLALHLMHAGEGVLIEIAPGARLDEPLRICCETDGRALPFILVLAGEGCRAAIEERFAVRGMGVIASVQRVHIAAGASLSCRVDHCGADDSRVFSIEDYTLGAEAGLRHLVRHRCAFWARQETTVELLGGGAHAELFSANSLSGRGALDQRTRQLHTVPGAASDLLYKNVLDGKSSAAYAGMILVSPGSHGTDAYQSNRNLMLSDKAEINSMPGLEILADDVRCSHGSATGTLDADGLFYLMSRGIPADRARRLVADGFLRDAVDRFLAGGALGG
ncbi:MAG: SufD family Fe-S cluster assembly protein [Akkermansiaceae bacterium]|nr:SufD family Fe-S cluster assembly protein [Akkermansiaceae bacterium]